jgi:hypothetical protein
MRERCSFPRRLFCKFDDCILIDDLSKSNRSRIGRSEISRERVATGYENGRSEEAAHLPPFVRALFPEVTLVTPYNEDSFATGRRSVRAVARPLVMRAFLKRRRSIVPAGWDSRG